jgi:hypothetical protein
MPDLVVIVPSRGRPEAARELAAAFDVTCTADTKLVFSLDADDTTAADYPKPRVVASNSSMVEALNTALRQYVLDGVVWPFAIGFMGDDHRPRTKGWDTAYLGALRELGTGIVYGDDLLQRRNLPTQCAMTADIARALGYMAPPALHHMYVDNFWLELGRKAGCIRYLPDVVVEHLHPVAGKAEWDDGYKRVNAPTVFAQDEDTFRRYLTQEMPAAVDTIRGLRPKRPEATGRVRLRPAYTADELAQVYATPHNHSQWGDHVVRVAVTAQFTHLLAGKVESAADLSCGDATILKALDVGTRYLGDFAPGYPITGPIDETIERIPVVDLFVCCETLEHLDDPDRTLKSIRAKTRALVLSTPVDAFGDTNPEHYWAWSRDDVEAMLDAAGFTTVVYSALDFRPSGADYMFGVWYCR